VSYCLAIVYDWFYIRQAYLVALIGSVEFYNKMMMMMRWEGNVAQIRAKRNAYWLLVGKTEGKRPLGRH
jgi:hypothetical protein